MSIGTALETLATDLPVRVSAYDGSAAGPSDAGIGLRLLNPRGLSYLLTAPGDLGLARAYVAGDMDIDGVHPGDPYEALVLLLDRMRIRRPTPSEAVALVRGLGIGNLRPPAPPPQEKLPRWRRTLEGLRHSQHRDASAISHHYDVSNRFYEMVLGPSMTYTCAVFPTKDATLEEAQTYKYDLVARKLDLKSGERLLDVGCGWGGMVRHAAKEYGVRALGVTLSLQQAQWAKEAIDREGLGDLAEVRHLDYRDVMESGFDAVSSIGLTEHIGVRNYPSYFGFLRDRLRPEGRLLNHCITRPHNQDQDTGAFIDRYVFPDGELTGSGRIISAAQDVGFEVMHEENFRRHYAMTLAGWCHNLQENWDECVAEVGEGTARVWGLYMAGSRLGFERNNIQLHHVLAAKTDEQGNDGFALRPTW
ncbi:MAG: class I SAM-dependent methyltransferase [Nocardioides sp.]|uniref:class I SAM-dependent methyltransferase n=1 Tax=Nocardioides sp. TaxID=35761 RepID=UPI0039E27A11